MILAFDTSAAHCAAALLSGDHVVARRGLAMSRGQAEALVPLLDDVLAEAGVTYGALTRIGVGIGPGNFTGIRISVACARGLALALGVPAVGISTFQAIRQGVAGATAAVPAPRGQVYLDQGGRPYQVASHEAPPDATLPPADPADLAIWIAQAAAIAPVREAPAPLYARPADAAPPRDQPPVL
ncbi:MAG: tRNA (adenosine(37)-N6)-threonylcarbamoyltransferase complex dimerization subunit type 1 TsaB, partial [Paracoccaceae bacterium]